MHRNTCLEDQVFSEKKVELRECLFMFKEKISNFQECLIIHKIHCTISFCRTHLFHFDPNVSSIPSVSSFETEDNHTSSEISSSSSNILGDFSCSHHTPYSSYSYASSEFSSCLQTKDTTMTTSKLKIEKME